MVEESEVYETPEVEESEVYETPEVEEEIMSRPFDRMKDSLGKIGLEPEQFISDPMMWDYLQHDEAHVVGYYQGPDTDSVGCSKIVVMIRKGGVVLPYATTYTTLVNEDSWQV